MIPTEADATAMGFLVNAIVDLRIPEEHYDFQSRLAAKHYPDVRCQTLLGVSLEGNPETEG